MLSPPSFLSLSHFYSRSRDDDTRLQAARSYTSSPPPPPTVPSPRDLLSCFPTTSSLPFPLSPPPSSLHFYSHRSTPYIILLPSQHNGIISTSFPALLFRLLPLIIVVPLIIAFRILSSCATAIWSSML